MKAAITNTSEVKQAAESLVGRVDAFYITLDNTVVSAVDTIIQTANDKKIPSSPVTVIRLKRELSPPLVLNISIMAIKWVKWPWIF